MYYTLDENKNVVACDCEYAMGESWQKNKFVASDKLEDGTWISTVFLPVDHGFGDFSEPVVFETMVFPNPKKNLCEEYGERYTTYEIALRRHKEIVEALKNNQPLRIEQND